MTARVVGRVELAELVEDLLRDENGLEPRLGLRPFDLDEREPVAVRRDHLDDAVLRLEERALQLQAHLLGRDREADLVDHPAQRAERQRQRRPAGRLGPRRVVARRQPVQPDAQLRFLALERDVVVLEHLELQLGVRRQLAHDVVQPPRGRRDRPGALLGGRRDLGQERRVEIRRRQRESRRFALPEARS